MDETIELVVFCNCRKTIPLLPHVMTIVPCKWTFRDDKKCPDVPKESHFDWECDPRIGSCPQGQYPQAENSDGIQTEKQTEMQTELQTVKQTDLSENQTEDQHWRRKLEKLERTIFELELEMKYIKNNYDENLEHLEKEFDSKYKIEYLEKDHQKSAELIESKTKLKFMENERNKAIKQMKIILSNFF